MTTHAPNPAAAVADQAVMVGTTGLVAAGATGQTPTDRHLIATYGEPVEVVQTHRGPMAITV